MYHVSTSTEILKVLITVRYACTISSCLLKYFIYLEFTPVPERKYRKGKGIDAQSFCSISIKKLLWFDWLRQARL